MNKREYPSQPLVGVGALVFNGGRVLLVKRGVEPSRGVWAIPGGMLNLGETLQEGAEREIREETALIIKAGEPIYTFDFFERDPQGRIRYHFVIIDLWAEYVSGEISSGDDAQEASWISPKELAKLPVSKNTLALLKRVNFGRNRGAEGSSLSF